MKFIATAEHTAGASVGHPCRFGLYSDPTDCFQVTVGGSTLEEAKVAALGLLKSQVRQTKPCRCHRKLEPGYKSWWDSVVIHLWPQDVESVSAWTTAGYDVLDDPYYLIPQSLKEEQVRL